MCQSDSGEPPSPTNLVRFWELDTPPTSYFRETEGTPEYGRRQEVRESRLNSPFLVLTILKVYNRDPIRVTPLIPYIGAQIREAEALCGPANFQVYLNRTDPTVLKQIQDALAQGE